jgi:hypothetical protein
MPQRRSQQTSKAVQHSVLTTLTIPGFAGFHVLVLVCCAYAGIADSNVVKHSCSLCQAARMFSVQG